MTIVIRVALCLGVWLAAAPVLAEPPDKAASAEHQNEQRGEKASKAKAKAKGKAKGNTKGKAKAKAKGKVKGRSLPAAEPASGDVPETADAADEPPSGDADEGTEPTASGPSVRRSNHMEFDARLVKGETAGSGAVVLFNRGARHLPRLTRLRTRFLDATVEPVLKRDGSKD